MEMHARSQANQCDLQIHDWQQAQLAKSVAAKPKDPQVCKVLDLQGRPKRALTMIILLFLFSPSPAPFPASLPFPSLSSRRSCRAISPRTSTTKRCRP